MGSSFSRGRKYSPTKNVSNNPSNLEHAKFSCSDAPTQNSNFVEGVVCKEAELRENEMKVFDLGKDDDKVLLVKKNGEIFALGPKCTHYGAPLVHGFLGKDRIRCQWHGACFNIKTGDIEDFPGLDSLPCFEVKVANGNVVVRAHREQLQTFKRVRPFTSTVNPTKSTFIVAGGGPAGTVCVENLRALGYDGRIIFIMGEKYLPYDRVKLSKSLDSDADKIALRTEEFFLARNVELKYQTLLENLNPKEHLAQLSSGETIKFDKIFLATGASPRRLRAPGANLKNIFYMRTVEDTRAIKSALVPTSNVVILGTSFIGMEIASYLIAKVATITVIGRSIPFKALLGEEIAKRIMELYEEKNTQFLLNQTILEFEGENNILTSVTLKDGVKRPADICIVAIGCYANTAYLNNAKPKTQDNCSLEVNEYMETQFADVYAGGDLAYAPVFKTKAVIGHWGLASYHGHIAAYNMVGKTKPLKAVPFFWTMLCGKGLRYAGHAPQFDEIIFEGSLEQLQFVAFYCYKRQVLAVCTINRDPLAAKFSELLYENKKLQKDRIKEWLRSQSI